jgi:Holliday junction DNA helicase RuvA
VIDFLRGRIVHREADWIVLDTGGVGYRIFCADPYAFDGDGETVTVYTHYHVREDAHLLYGFASRDEQRLFRKLLDVNGVGPRVALGMLAGASPEALIAAIVGEDDAYLSRLPGIGKKTAQRIILDLKDKLDEFRGMAAAASEAGTAARPAKPAANAAWEEAKQALMALGYKEAELERVWTAVAAEAPADAAVDQLMKLALKALYKG